MAEESERPQLDPSLQPTDCSASWTDPAAGPGAESFGAAYEGVSLTSESSIAGGETAHLGGDGWSIADDAEEIRSEAEDSALGDDVPESTASLRSSLYQGVQENGRFYHKYKEGKYVLPSDEKEWDRLDLQHHLFLMTTDMKLALAPIVGDPAHVIDLGTGTGIWAIDFAETHPNSQVIGVDLSPQQPEFVPPNCRFEIDDVEEPWTWNQKFDYVHARMMASSIADVPKFFRQCFEHTAPGGWLELQDTHFPLTSQDGTLHEGTALYQWAEKLVSGLRIFQREIATPRYKALMEEAGYVDVTEVQFVWPQNPWPKDKKLKELGRWNLVNMLDGLEGYSMALLTRAHGMSPEEVQVFLSDVRKDMKNPKIHSYWPIYFVYGRKP
ncbi:uncharacterized protein PV09_07834 [Verruconis gallopava]|uniref:Methyltransferase domain-containing protein n=1 Tax=Verruconis gallopava TaxID=253628 RepID=A0A0D1XEM4_9PEZI|nr:uncharacterized protein PV09_07834 [Verruconis gallopava]KIW00641.1 hypothetical protein PV09_07834 [Verruconis gallopava]